MNGSWAVRAIVLLAFSCLALGVFLHLTPLQSTSSEGSDLPEDDEDAGLESADDASFEPAPSKKSEPIPMNGEPDAGLLYGVGLGLLGLLLLGSGLSGAVFVAVLMALVTPLVAKKTRQDVLNRGRVLGFVEANAGIYFSAIMGALGLANGVTAHHLQTLERHGAIISWRDGKMRRYASAHIDPESIPNLRSPLVGTRLAILETLAKAGSLGLTTRELRERLDLSRQLLHYHMTHLADRTLVEKSAPNRRAPWRLTSDGVSALDV
ncbi:MAG: winged helix-turn-helix transcriptional regulator [Candidatus Poseidoniaceae archaeon]